MKNYMYYVLTFKADQMNIAKSIIDILYDEELDFNVHVIGNIPRIMIKCFEDQYEMIRGTILEAYNYDISKNKGTL